MYKSKNGYFKHYSKNGTPCRIKVTRDALRKTDSDFLIAFKNRDEETWNYHIPNKNFRCANAVIVFILKNLETPNTVFKIL